MAVLLFMALQLLCVVRLLLWLLWCVVTVPKCVCVGVCVAFWWLLPSLQGAGLYVAMHVSCIATLVVITSRCVR